MRSLLAVLTALVILGSSNVAYALSTETQITTTNIQKRFSYIKIHVSDADDGCKLFQVIVTPRDGIKPEDFKGELSVHSDGKLIVGCSVYSRKLGSRSDEAKDIDVSLREKSVIFEFVVSASHLESSKFSAVQWFPPTTPAFDSRWFYLKDFVSTK